MSEINPLPQNPFEKKIVHVFLGRGRKGTQKILVLAPNHPEIEQIQCILTSTPFSPVQHEPVKFEDELIRLYRFEFNDLIDGQTYSYRFMANGKPLDMGGGLKDSDLYFQYWDSFKDHDSLIHMSCNGLFYFKHLDQKWDMWQRLSDEIESGYLNPRLLVLGGDQYYQDPIEEKWLSQLDAKTFTEKEEEFTRDSIKNALMHWEGLPYRKVLARIPSVAMLDDHDITDGANGDRKEFYEGETAKFNEKWTNYNKVQRKIFALAQASRNPTPSDQKGHQAFSFIIELNHDTALVALDLRTEKNARLKIVQDETSKKYLFDDINRLTQKNVMIVVPVVPVRNSSKIEDTALNLAKMASGIEDYLNTRQGGEHKKMKKGASYLADLEDDLTDALCSEPNRDYLFELLELIMDGAAKGVNYTLLSGDIHTAGSVEIILERGPQKVTLPLLVSSPIGYDPMSFIVEALLKEKKMIDISHKGIRLKAVNHAFTTNRNFMAIVPSKLITAPHEAVRLYEEGIEGDKAVIVKGWNTDRSRPVADKTNILASQVQSDGVKPV